MDSESIDLFRLLRILRKRMWVLVLCAFLSVGLAGVYSFFVVEEQYSADVLLYIWQEKKTDGQDNFSSSDLQLFAQLVNDYQVLAKSRLVTSTVAEELGLGPSSVDRLSRMIAVGTRSNTRHLTITVTDVDPVFAATVANKVASVFAQVVVDKMGAGNVNIIDDAIVPKSPSSPNKPMNMAVGLVLGLMIGIGAVFLIEMLDTRVKTTDDIEAITGLTLLGAIPEFEHNLEDIEGRR